MTDIVEQDTIQSENTSDIVGFIRDGMPDSDKCLQEGFLFNRRVFNGWVKQPSACCAAASVAGAFNALACLQRGDDGSLNHSDILRIYESMFIDLIAKHKADFQRRLGAPIDDILVSIEKELKDIGREIGGAKGHNATKTSVANAILKICRKRAAAPQSEGTVSAAGDDSGAAAAAAAAAAVSEASSSFDFTPRDAVDCLSELFQLDGILLIPEAPPADEGNEDISSLKIPEGGWKGQGRGTGDQQEQEQDQQEDEDAKGESEAGDNEEGPDEDEDDVTVGVLRWAPGKIRPGKKGLKKGNWGVMQAVERLSEWTALGTHLQARLFMGKKRIGNVKMDVSLSSKDNTRTVTAQWDSLRSAFAQPYTVLLLHLKNHYALVFALREWTSGADPGPSSDQIPEIDSALCEQPAHGGGGDADKSDIKDNDNDNDKEEEEGKADNENLNDLNQNSNRNRSKSKEGIISSVTADEDVGDSDDCVGLPSDDVIASSSAGALESTMQNPSQSGIEGGSEEETMGEGEKGIEEEQEAIVGVVEKKNEKRREKDDHDSDKDKEKRKEKIAPSPSLSSSASASFTSSSSCVRRQMLTARRGQRPTAWIDFQEMRETMLDWQGYKIIAITYQAEFPCPTIAKARITVPEEYGNLFQK